MLDLIRKGWWRVVRFFFGETPSTDKDIVERPGQEIPVDTIVPSSVLTIDDSAPDQDFMECTGTGISADAPSTTPVPSAKTASPDTDNDVADSIKIVPPVDTLAPSSVLTGDDTAPDKESMEITGTGIPADTPSTLPVPTAETTSPDTDNYVADSTRTVSPADALSPSSVPADRTVPSNDFSRWTITEGRESPFEKCGRLYVEGDDLVIRTDLDTRGFRVPLRDIVAVLDGEPQPIRVLMKGNKVGIAKRSASGKAMNFIIDPYLYTVPLSRVMDVLEGRARKAAVFVGRGDNP